MVDRYDYESTMREFSDGDYVLYEDYKALEKENEKLKKEIAELRYKIEELREIKIIVTEV